MIRKTLISWSSGKDSAWMLHVLRQDPTIEVAGLFCTVNQVFSRVAMHGVRIELLNQQARSLNLPLHIIYIPDPCSNREYMTLMFTFIGEAKKKGIECFAFGDLFLDNVRQYREKLLKGTGIEPIFPIWGLSTKILSREMIVRGLRARITCVNPEYLSIEFLGREYNVSFLNELPEEIDPCGENGEFHSFAFDGPMFQHPIEIVPGATIQRNGCYFTDLNLKNEVLCQTSALLQ